MRDPNNSSTRAIASAQVSGSSFAASALTSVFFWVLAAEAG